MPMTISVYNDRHHSPAPSYKLEINMRGTLRAKEERMTYHDEHPPTFS